MSCPRERLSRWRGIINLQRTTRELQILIQVAYVEKLFKLLGQGEVQMKGGEYSISFLPRMRNRLKANRLDVLMTIDIEGPPSVDFDFSLALEEWAIKNRRILKS